MTIGTVVTARQAAATATGNYVKACDTHIPRQGMRVDGE